MAMESSQDSDIENRVLVLAPVGRDGELACRVLRGNAIAAVRCKDVPELLRFLSEGAGALLITDEALSDSKVAELAAALSKQPAWSDVPIILISSQDAPLAAKRALTRVELLGHVTLLDRPLRLQSLLTVVRTALRARSRQYEARAMVARLKEGLTQLARSRARADYATQISGVGFWYCDLPFDELKWDTRVKDHFFLPHDARVTIDTFFERIIPDDRDRTRAAIEASIGNHTPYDIIYRTHEPASSAVKWVRALGGASYGADGTPVHFDGVTVDVSEQKRAEEAQKSLAEAERAALLAAAEAGGAERRRLLSLLEQVPAIVNFLRGPDLVFEFAHPKAVKALGGRELLGKPILEAIPEHHGQPFYARMRRVFETGEPYHQKEARARLVVDGTEVISYWDSVYLPVRDESGRIEGVMTFDLDVTDGVTARQQNAEATAELEAVFANVPIGVGFMDRDLRFRRVNRVLAEEINGFPIEEHLGKTGAELLPNLRDYLEPTLNGVLATGQIVEQEVTGETPAQPGQHRVWKTIHFPVKRGSGEVLGIGSIVQDITAHKEIAERERVALLKAEEASRAKDDFLAMLGHELRNPLAPIATAVHLLKLRSKDGLAREIGIIERQSQHIARLVEDLLDVSRIAQGKVVLTKDTIEIAELVAAAIEIASPVIENARHRLVVNVLKQDLVVDADRGRMTQVLANLLTNAAKYTSPGGTIHVTAARDGSDVVISVQDSGVGISAELLPHVFDLFVQARQTLDRSQGGLGLGLALVKNLVAMHGGTVSADSAGLGRGSTFSVRLPRSDATTKAREEDLSLPPGVAPTHQHRILIVDDNADGADMLAEVLESLGYRTVIAHDGPDALRLAGDFAPHVALLDIGLPVMNGYELAMRLRADWPDVKLVAVTGYGQEGDRLNARRAGFQAHLTKPVDFERLASLLATF
ncbi:MAG TPA: PAS domain-containing protein [Polyangiaceae bacterium]|nr:PAS domain-containing protein [Polyangiaceae bacterium]